MITICCGYIRWYRGMFFEKILRRVSLRKIVRQLLLKANQTLLYKLTENCCPFSLWISDMPMWSFERKEVY